MKSLVTVLVLAALASVAHARTPASLQPNIQITTAGAWAPVLTPSDRGGVIVAWQGSRYLGKKGSYAQRLSASGVAQWLPGGVFLGSVDYVSSPLSIASDGAGGAIVAWISGYEPEVIAQHVDALGHAQWGPEGRQLGTTKGAQGSYYPPPSIAPDGSGGAVVVWVSQYSPHGTYAQRVDAAGRVLWRPGGVRVSNYPAWPSPSIAASGDGGVILSWWVLNSTTPIRAQKLGPDGSLQWADSNGVVVASIPAFVPVTVSDGAGGAYVVFGGVEGDFYVTANIYAQHLDAAGHATWGARPLAVCTAANQQTFHVADADGTGGVIVAWQDWRTGTNFDVYAQRLAADGTAMWGENGLPVCTAPHDQVAISIAGDGRGGVKLAWGDQRDLLYQHTYNVYAQAISAGGSALWGTNGLPLGTPRNGQWFQVIASPGPQQAFVAWVDRRSGASELYGQAIVGSGQLPAPGAALAHDLEPAGSARPLVIEQRTHDGLLALQIPEGEPAVLDLFDVAGRRVLTYLLHSGAQTLDVRARLPSGVYLIRLRQRGGVLAKRVAILR